MEPLADYAAAFLPDSVPLVPAIGRLDDITRDWAWQGSTGAGVKVAIIDSGVNAEHPAVGHVEGYVTISQGPDGLELDERPHGDAYGQGTACAGIVRSLAPDCQLFSIRALQAHLVGQSQVFSAGLAWAIEHGMHVCNLSLGTSRPELYNALHELADEAYFRNVVLVSAANNLPMPSFPSVYASVIAVAAHGVQDPELFYYNPHPPVEFGALGMGVRVAWQDKTWITATGNTFAAPHMTGLVARILSKHPELTAFQVKMVLRALAANVVRPD